MQRRIAQTLGIALIIIGAILLFQRFYIIADPRSKIGTAKVELAEIAKSLQHFYQDCGYFPNSDLEMNVLVEKPGNCTNWTQPYLKKYPIVDPWGHKYFYERHDASVRIGSYGADGKLDGTGDNASVIIEIKP